MYEIFSKLSKNNQYDVNDVTNVFIVRFEQISHIVLVFPLLTGNIVNK